ncbi:hypothetical protein CSV72_07085 [Sporosarcina sp. P20a]|uniref:hypothetical protein n=1 Tax=Sporosarcina sp. P20a TaxID=2048256 RepID=UPI000C16C7EC|nr:hypothetical protein [Sporosarcina sp. P20a]PIC86603.1 hypothetical protein CSV72_07085 [Sporosarcina sp. P20a]
MLLIISLLMWCVGEILINYRVVRKKRLLFEDRFTKTICMAIASISSFATALYFELLLPEDQIATYLLPVFLGVFIGWRFGSLIKAPASLNGLYNGAMGGVMGMMLGAVLKNPALCNIPIDANSLIMSNLFIVTIFIAFSHSLVCFFIRRSMRG